MILPNKIHSLEGSIQFVIILRENVQRGRMSKEKILVMGWPRKKSNKQVMKEILLTE